MQAKLLPKCVRFYLRLLLKYVMISAGKQLQDISGKRKEELRVCFCVMNSITDNGGFALGFWFALAQDQPAVYSPLVLAHASLYCRITFGWLEKEY